ncbi:GCN5-related N-acetyltransferase [Chlorella sorokiniana]|uniref:GCN5-related N-acetyltransferase n=1 Tax=Chlorella sorokiniana TaxID=3076 RepID=A0A2P6TKE0_CHLSO|nr:GCN5-related N-acetyltransferase [Chlorella sorokiniana]|eukprot:PRW44553.1 GCN5-related N-acetyltransferase [Chlorella sorokiniana]
MPQPPVKPAAVKVRPARLGSNDTPFIAGLFAQAFSLQPHSSGPEGGGGSGGGCLEGLTLCPPRSAADWQRQVETALISKHAAAEESRRQRLDRQALILAAEAARRSGRPPLMVPVLTQADRQQVQRWRRQRSFVVLVAEDPSSGELLGSAAVSLAQPEAALPPPFPTTKPRRTYVSNIATLPQHRRKGVATALLRQCERQARLWRRDSLWLHVELDNAPARQLYEKLGYQEVGRDPVFTPNRRCLMRKEVEPCHAPSNNIVSSAGTIRVSASSSEGSGGGSSGSSSRKSGVFIWSEDVEL